MKADIRVLEGNSSHSASWDRDVAIPEGSARAGETAAGRSHESQFSRIYDNPGTDCCLPGSISEKNRPVESQHLWHRSGQVEAELNV